MSASNSQQASGAFFTSTSTMPLRTAPLRIFFRASAAVCPATTCKEIERVRICLEGRPLLPKVALLSLSTVRQPLQVQKLQVMR